ncbi:MAG: hypothetical protein AB7N99_09795 [Simkaniaceae bacterium]
MAVKFQTIENQGLITSSSVLHLGGEQNKLDHLFHEQLEEYVGPRLEERLQVDSLDIAEVSVAKQTHGVAVGYLKSLGGEIASVDRMFDASSGGERAQGSRQFMATRKEFGRRMFIDAVRPQIEMLLKKHGDRRSFDEVVSIFGFNRLFMRELGSAGTDVDFFMLVDTKDDALMKDIHALMKTEIAPMLGMMGIDMETADYLMIRKDQYMAKLSETHKSLFTLANTGYVDFITGSGEMLREAFTLTNEQLAGHFVTLLQKNGQITGEEAPKIYEAVLGKISGSPAARRELQQLLRQMASSELYIGKTPYKGKKTIQTELAKVSEEAVMNRTAKISIKFNFNRIADMYLTTGVDRDGKILSPMQIRALETLSTVLSNIKCRIDDKKVHPLLTVQENYSDLSLADIQKMSREDRVVVAELLEAFGIELDPLSEQFPNQAYDALWGLSLRMGKVARGLEEMIYLDALEFIPKPAPVVQKNTWSWGATLAAVGGATVVILGAALLINRFAKK